MTKVEITIQDRNGKPTVTWIDHRGDDLPKELWEDLTLAVARVFDKRR